MIKKIFIRVIGFIILIISLIFWLTSGMSDVANDFFNTLKYKQYQEAYKNYLSANFKEQITIEQFINYIKQNRLDSVKSTSWSNREFTENKGKLSGSVTFEDGSSIPLNISFYKNQDSWKIDSIYKPKAGLEYGKTDKQNITKATKLPSAKVQINLVNQTINDFKEFLKSGDIKQFYNNLSPIWKSQKSQDDLKDAFSQTLKSANLILQILSKEFILKESSIDNNGLMHILVEYLPTKNNVGAYIKLDYYFQNAKWQLIGFEIEPISK